MHPECNNQFHNSSVQTYTLSINVYVNSGHPKRNQRILRKVEKKVVIYQKKKKEKKVVVKINPGNISRRRKRR